MKLQRWIEQDDDGPVEIIVVTLLAGETTEALIREVPPDAVLWQAYCRRHGEEVDLIWRRQVLR